VFVVSPGARTFPWRGSSALCPARYLQHLFRRLVRLGAAPRQEH